MIYYCVMLLIGLLLSPGCRSLDRDCTYEERSLEILPDNGSSDDKENSGFIPTDSLGIFLLLTESEQQIGPVTKYTMTSTGWHSDNRLNLSRDHYTAYAYYPYNPAVVSPESIPLRFDLTDYMWAHSEETDINSQKPLASFTMQRLLARVSLTIIVKGEYEKPGLLSDIGAYNAVEKNSISTDASLCSFDGRTGNLKRGTQPLGGFLPLLHPDGRPIQNLELGPGKKKIGDLLVIPFRFTDGDISFQMTIDEKYYTLQIPSPSGYEVAANGGWNQGCHYHYTLTMNAVGHITIGSISVNDWINVPDVEPELDE